MTKKIPALAAAVTACLLMTAALPGPRAQEKPARAKPEAGASVFTTNPDKDKPLEITADNTLEWHRDIKQFIARGNALAVQGATSVRGDILTADYRENSAGSTEIWRVTASGNVEIKSQDSTARGDRGVYDLDRGAAVLTGKTLKMTTPEQTVTASDSFEYWVAEGRLTAIGNAKLVRGQDTLEADKLSAFFEEKSGKKELSRIEADGHVVITTPEEKLTGDEGVYRADSNTAEVTGDVKITRGPNVLEGKKARIDLATNVSSLIGEGGDQGRVRGVFYPESEKKKEKE